MKSTAPLSISTLLMMAGCATTFTPGAPPGAVDVIAHRGASAYAPENTLAAFRRAIEMQADWFELDCHLTKDGLVVVLHDGKLDRTAGAQGAVADHTLAELKQLDAGAWFAPEFAGERLPTLTESLALAKGRIGVYAEIKNVQDDTALFTDLLAQAGGSKYLSPQLRQAFIARIEASGTRNLALTRAVIADIRKAKMEKEVVIQSFSPIQCFITLVEAPELRTEFLVSRDKDNPAHWDEYVNFGRLIGVAGFNARHESLDLDTLRAFHQEGRSVAVWTVDDPERMQQLANWGVDAIITNKPDLAIETLHAAKRHP